LSIYSHLVSSGQRPSQFTTLLQKIFCDLSFANDRAEHILEFITQGDSLNGVECP
jgi:hypothetical protein